MLPLLTLMVIVFGVGFILSECERRWWESQFDEDEGPEDDLF